jgi:hypothetical protein
MRMQSCKALACGLGRENSARATHIDLPLPPVVRAIVHEVRPVRHARPHLQQYMSHNILMNCI